jgi:hypothetical protein
MGIGVVPLFAGKMINWDCIIPIVNYREVLNFSRQLMEFAKKTFPETVDNWFSYAWN